MQITGAKCFIKAPNLCLWRQIQRLISPPNTSTPAPAPNPLYLSAKRSSQSKSSPAYHFRLRPPSRSEDHGRTDGRKVTRSTQEAPLRWAGGCSKDATAEAMAMVSAPPTALPFGGCPSSGHLLATGETLCPPFSQLQLLTSPLTSCYRSLQSPAILDLAKTHHIAGQVEFATYRSSHLDLDLLLGVGVKWLAHAQRYGGGGGVGLRMGIMWV